MIIKILLLLWPVVCRAEQWQSLIQAQSMADFLKAEKEISQNQNNQENCDLEKSEGHFPEYCMKKLWVDLEEPQHRIDLERQIRQIDELCLKYARYLRRQEDLDLYLLSPVLTDSCRQHLEELKKDLIYKDSGKIGPEIENESGHGKSSYQTEPLSDLSCHGDGCNQ